MATTVAAEAAAYGERDYKTQLTTIKNANPEAVFLPYYGADAAMILAQAKDMRNAKVISAYELYQQVARKYGIDVVPLTGPRGEA